MKPVDQDLFIESGRGNCLQACVASILGVSLSAVPNFHDCPEGFWGGFYRFMESNGYIAFETTANFHGIEAYHIVNGRSPRGAGNHACVGFDGKIVHDPHPSRAGVTLIVDVFLLVAIDAEKNPTRP